LQTVPFRFFSSTLSPRPSTSPPSTRNLAGGAGPPVGGFDSWLRRLHPDPVAGAPPMRGSGAGLLGSCAVTRGYERRRRLLSIGVGGPSALPRGAGGDAAAPHEQASILSKRVQQLPPRALPRRGLRFQRLRRRTCTRPSPIPDRTRVSSLILFVLHKDKGCLRWASTMNWVCCSCWCRRLAGIGRLWMVGVSIPLPKSCDWWRSDLPTCH
jgi:hypothetical protein